MKRLLFVLSIALIAAGVGFAQFDDPFMPQNPIVMGQGGSFVANAEGYNAFFNNPAGFARGGELTLTSINAWAFVDRRLLEFALEMLQGNGPSFPSASIVSRQTQDELSASFLQEALGQEAYDQIAQAFGEEAVGQLDETVGALVQFAEDNPDDIETVLQDTVTNLEEQAAANPDSGLNELVTALEAATSGEEIDPASLVSVVGAGLDTVEIVVDSFVQAVEENPNDLAVPTVTNAEGETVAISGSQLTEVFRSALPGGTIRAGAMVGLASWVGSGVGFGVFANAATNITGETILNSRGRAFVNLTGVFGLSFNILEGLSVGASIRPSLLGYTNINPSSLIGDFLGAPEGGEAADPIATLFNRGIFYGGTVGLDVGALWDIGPFTLGAAFKDLVRIGPDYSKLTLADFENISGPQDVLTVLEQGGSEITDPNFVPWIPPLNISVGAQFHPDLGVLSFLIDPRVSVDIRDMFEFIRILQLPESDPRRAEWTVLDMLHIGAEVTFLEFATVRAGIYRDFLSAGVGLKLLFMDVNAAITGDFDPYALQEGQLEFGTVGASIEAAIRF